MELMIEEKPPLSAMGHVIESIGLDHIDIQSKCRACNQQIEEKQICRIGSSLYHTLCVRCIICGESVNSQCYERNGQIYCSSHYFKECSPYRCAGCKLGISPRDMVYKLRTGMVFHVTCHCCNRCGRPLSPGEQILVDEMAKTVACMNHYYQDQSLCTFPSCSTDNTFPSDQYSEFQVKKEIDTYGYGNYDGYSFADFCDEDSKFLKRRGPRTTIKQNQLDVLNRIFSTTPKPSKHARAKLALETGLSMRVIQVWFQNRRSKERRLKHLCNYLRHYEERGLIPPPINFNPNGESSSSDVLSFNQYVDGMEVFDDDDDDE